MPCPPSTREPRFGLQFFESAGPNAWLVACIGFCESSMRRRLPQIARVIAAGVLALLPASATTLEKLSLDDMIAKSTSIVRGRVQGCNGEYKAPIIYTHCKVAVSEHWKGAAPAVADV